MCKIDVPCKTRKSPESVDYDVSRTTVSGVYQTIRVCLDLRELLKGPYHESIVVPGVSTEKEGVPMPVSKIEVGKRLELVRWSGGGAAGKSTLQQQQPYNTLQPRTAVS